MLTSLASNPSDASDPMVDDDERIGAPASPGKRQRSKVPVDTQARPPAAHALADGSQPPPKGVPVGILMVALPAAAFLAAAAMSLGTPPLDRWLGGGAALALAIGMTAYVVSGRQRALRRRAWLEARAAEERRAAGGDIGDAKRQLLSAIAGDVQAVYSATASLEAAFDELGASYGGGTDDAGPRRIAENGLAEGAQTTRTMAEIDAAIRTDIGVALQPRRRLSAIGSHLADVEDRAGAVCGRTPFEGGDFGTQGSETDLPRLAARLERLAQEARSGPVAGLDHPLTAIGHDPTGGVGALTDTSPVGAQIAACRLRALAGESSDATEQVPHEDGDGNSPRVPETGIATLRAALDQLLAERGDTPSASAGDLDTRLARVPARPSGSEDRTAVADPARGEQATKTDTGRAGAPGSLSRSVAELAARLERLNTDGAGTIAAGRADLQKALSTLETVEARVSRLERRVIRLPDDAALAEARRMAERYQTLGESVSALARRIEGMHDGRPNGVAGTATLASAPQTPAAASRSLEDARGRLS